MPDGELEKYLDVRDSRQLLHITYGGLLEDPGIRSAFFDTLRDNEELHYAAVEQHLEKHVRLLGVAGDGRRTGESGAPKELTIRVRRGILETGEEDRFLLHHPSPCRHCDAVTRPDFLKAGVCRLFFLQRAEHRAVVYPSGRNP